MQAIADIQNTPDHRNQPIHRVGISRLRMPLTLATESGTQATVATVAMSVFLPAHIKGTHMSRFVALIQSYDEALDFDGLKRLTFTMLHDLDAQAGEITIEAPFFRSKTAPVSGIKSQMDYGLTLKGEKVDGIYRQSLTLVIPVTSLCPCSKEISDYGAHNQRSHITVTLVSQNAIDIEALIDKVEGAASCQLYGLLKRPDEKFVTEFAYDHPKFVEDLVRDVAGILKEQSAIDSFVVESENFESIHNHSAWAKIIYP